MFDTPMNRLNHLARHFAGTLLVSILPLVSTLLLASTLLLSCGHRRGPLTEKESTVIRDSVTQLTANIARDLSANGPAVWLNYFEDAPGFFMVDDGSLSFPDYNSAKHFVQDTLVKLFPHITLNWSSVRIHPLSRRLA